MDKVNISVVLPVYRGMPLLKQSIESIIDQNEEDFELLIGNDDIHDSETRLYLKTIAHPKVRIFNHEKNLGLFKNLNFLIQKATGTIIHLWSQDDIMTRNCLKDTFSFHASNPEVAYAFSKVIVIDSVGKEVERQPLHTNTTISKEKHAIISSIAGSMPGNIANVSIAKERFLEVGYFNENMRYSGDFEFWARLARKRNVGVINKHLIFLRRHEKQLSRNPDMWIYRLKENQEILKIYKETVPKSKLKYVKKGIKWRVYNQYFSLYLSLCKNNGFMKSFAFLKELHKQSNIPAIIFRWLILKTFTFVKLDKKLLYKIYYHEASK